MIDPFHMEAYGQAAVNYNRDVEIFPVLNAMFERIYGESPYKSPTDMGVNMAGFCITDDAACRAASQQEIIRRYFAAAVSLRQGLGGQNEVYKEELLMNQVGVRPEDRAVVPAARARGEETDGPAVAMEMPDAGSSPARPPPCWGPPPPACSTRSNTWAASPATSRSSPRRSSSPSSI